MSDPAHLAQRLKVGDYIHRWHLVGVTPTEEYLERLRVHLAARGLDLESDEVGIRVVARGGA